MIESSRFYVKTLEDAMLVINAVELGELPIVSKRLSPKDRLAIESGSCFVWREGHSKISRWTDGFYWTASRIHGHFLVYKQTLNRVKVEDGLIKKTISFITLSKNKFHLVCYYKKSDIENLMRPIDVLNTDSEATKRVENSLEKVSMTENESTDENTSPLPTLPSIAVLNIGSWIDKDINDQFRERVSQSAILELNKNFDLY